MPYTKAGRRALPYPQHRKSVDEGIVEGYLSACEQENRELRGGITQLQAELGEVRKHDFNCVRDWYDKNQCPHGVWWYDRHRP